MSNAGPGARDGKDWAKILEICFRKKRLKNTKLLMDGRSGHNGDIIQNGKAVATVEVKGPLGNLKEETGNDLGKSTTAYNRSISPGSSINPNGLFLRKFMGYKKSRNHLLGM
jgi:hypothetical protein